MIYMQQIIWVICVSSILILHVCKLFLHKGKPTMQFDLFYPWIHQLHTQGYGNIYKHVKYFNSNYDKIIFACHADQVEKNIKDISELEKEALNLFDYNKNRVVLHTDESLMPESKVDWTAWNSYNDKQNDYVTYWMNELQDLNIDKNIFVTLCLN